MITCTEEQPWQRSDGPALHPDAYVAHGKVSSATRALRRCPHCGANFEIPRDANVLCFECGQPGADVVTKVEIEGTDPIEWMGVEVHAHHFPDAFVPGQSWRNVP